MVMAQLIGLLINWLLELEKKIMADLSAIHAGVDANTAAVEALSGRVHALEAEVAAGGVDPAEVQAIADQLGANNAALDALAVPPSE